MLKLRSGKDKITKGIELPKKKKINKDQNVWRKGNLQILGNMGSGYNQKRDERNNSKTNEKASENQDWQHKSHQRDIRTKGQ